MHKCSIPFQPPYHVGHKAYEFPLLNLLGLSSTSTRRLKTGEVRDYRPYLMALARTLPLFRLR